MTPASLPNVTTARVAAILLGVSPFSEITEAKNYTEGLKESIKKPVRHDLALASEQDIWEDEFNSARLAILARLSERLAALTESEAPHEVGEEEREEEDANEGEKNLGDDQRLALRFPKETIRSVTSSINSARRERFSRTA